jgi:hypothetical protein
VALGHLVVVAPLLATVVLVVDAALLEALLLVDRVTHLQHRQAKEMMVVGILVLQAQMAAAAVAVLLVLEEILAVHRTVLVETVVAARHHPYPALQ